ncbi:hypothetical protein EDC04DRAFT_2605986 [Pisolithus marmoratus]|nr:hypothetical protein EDC04DRAFT_2605986 [Pisolithus marmoratus]
MSTTSNQSRSLSKPIPDQAHRDYTDVVNKAYMVQDNRCNADNIITALHPLSDTIDITRLQHGHIMDELAHARAELVQLQSTERMLVEQFLAVRIAIETQKSKINKLVEERCSLINRLPIELLTRILSFLLTSDNADLSPYILPTLRRSLASVSRLWRDLILNTPTFWSKIGLIHNSDSKSLMTQLKRSREHLLDVAILYISKGSLDALLDIVISSANHWRNLTLKILKSVSSPTLYASSMGSNFPASKMHLDLGQLSTSERFSMTTTTLTTLSLSIKSSIPNPSFFSHIPTQSLTALTITEFENEAWVLGRDTLYFPVLRRLLLDVVNPYVFMDAIVTPTLEHFEYTHRPDSAFSTFGSKFNHVCHFTSKPRSHWDELKDSDVYALCQTFSGVRYASLPAIDIKPIFMASSADNWEKLQSLSIICDHHDGYWDVDALAKWLGKRKLGLPPVHVQLIGSDDAQMEIETFSSHYNQLQDLCILDFKDMRLSDTLRLSMDGGFLNVRVDNIECVTLKNWRELSLENVDLLWLRHETLSLVKTVSAEALVDLVKLFLIFSGRA